MHRWSDENSHRGAVHRFGCDSGKVRETEAVSKVRNALIHCGAKTQCGCFGSPMSDNIPRKTERRKQTELISDEFRPFSSPSCVKCCCDARPSPGSPYHSHRKVHFCYEKSMRTPPLLRQSFVVTNLRSRKTRETDKTNRQ
jgi:hypothetical protein